MTKKYQYHSFILKPDGTVEEKIHPKQPEYEWLRDTVGGLIQPVGYLTKYTDANGKEWKRGTAYVNEEGLIISLPFNHQATMLWAGQYDHATLLVGNLVITFREKLDD